MNGNDNTSRNSYGILINSDALLHRQWFEEMVRLHGEGALYEYPINGKYNQNGEFVCDNYSPPTQVGVIYEQRPKLKTTKLLHWNSQLQDEASLVHIPYNTENLMLNGRVIMPSPYDASKGDVFRIVEMSAVSAIYPDAISCAIVPVWADKFDKSQFDYTNSTLNLLFEEEED